DREETVRERLRVYMAETEPLVDFYERKGLLVAVDGEKDIDEVTGAIVSAVEEGNGVEKSITHEKSSPDGDM
ncbi:MAG: hypothetical protein AB1700_19045, partial [Bacillota bacterium]